MDSPAETRQRRTISSMRVEAFSDAVFAITITLLVIEIGRPAVGNGELASKLLHQWPEFLAFAVSFVYVGVIWLNHHALFAGIRQVDIGLNWINLGILGTSALVPFPTGVLASALSEGSHADQQAAVVLYGIVAALMSAAWIPVFPYFHLHPDLLVDSTEAQLFRSQRSRPWVGIISFGLAALVGYLLSPWIAIVLFVWMVAYHAATSEGLHANRIARLFTREPTRQTGDARKGKTMDETSNREKAEKAFRDWQDGTAYITDLLADDLQWTIVGRSEVSKTYNSKEEFIGEVLQPFGARFSEPFRPVKVRGLYDDGDTVVVLWDGEGTRLDGKPYENTYAWFMRFREGLVVEATAFYDSIAFNELWNEVAPAD
jgi:uncharacterized membrane protein/ketosteroid isomerase-like protein